MRRYLLALPVLAVVPVAVWGLLRPPSPPSGFARADDPPGPEITADGALPVDKAMEKFAREDPVAFLENCLRRYRKEVQEYSTTFKKQERLSGRLKLPEVIEARYREKPFSVYFRWQENPGRAERVLYVEGENNGKMLVRPAGALQRRLAGDVVERDVEGADAKQSGRYPISQSGVRRGMERTWKSWKAARDKGALHVEYLGNKDVAEVGRRCWVLRRTSDEAENDGVWETTIYVDRENWLQVRSVLKGDKQEGSRLLIGEYTFKDVRLNPGFDPKQFQREALTP